MKPMSFLEINRLKKRYGALEILKGIDLTLEKGGFLVLVEVLTTLFSATVIGAWSPAAKVEPNRKSFQMLVNW